MTQVVRHFVSEDGAAHYEETMTEEAFLRYRLAVVERMPDSPYKRALINAIQDKMQMLGVRVPADPR